jgi:hypothetical protein
LSKIANALRGAVKQGSQYPGIIVDAGGGYATVRLSNTGAIYTNLEVVGGYARNGDICIVDFSSSIPFIIIVQSKAQESVKKPKKPIPSRAGVGSKTTTTAGSTGGSTGGSSGGSATPYGIILYGDGVIKDGWEASDANLDIAISDSVSGDVIYLPNATISGNHTIPSGVSLVGLTRYGSILSGAIILSGGNSLENLSINGSGAANRLTINGDVTLRSCDIVQSNAGYDALYLSAGYSLIRECHIEGPGNGVAGTGGASVHFFGCDFACLVDIDATNIDVTVYGDQYDTVVGTITSALGDRATYSGGSGHSSDIANGEYVYHIPVPNAGSGQVPVSDGTQWIATVLEPVSLDNHASTHGHNGADELIHVAPTEPSIVFAGKLWLQT